MGERGQCLANSGIQLTSLGVRDINRRYVGMYHIVALLGIVTWNTSSNDLDYLSPWALPLNRGYIDLQYERMLAKTIRCRTA